MPRHRSLSGGDRGTFYSLHGDTTLLVAAGHPRPHQEHRLAASKVWQRPVGDVMPAAANAIDTDGVSMALTLVTSASSQSPPDAIHTEPPAEPLSTDTATAVTEHPHAPTAAAATLEDLACRPRSLNASSAADPALSPPAKAARHLPPDLSVREEASSVGTVPARIRRPQPRQRSEAADTHEGLGGGQLGSSLAPPGLTQSTAAPRTIPNTRLTARV